MEYIQPLLEFASKNIPQEHHKETPLYILATAGMRLLPKEDREPILSNLRSEINSKYAFLFPDGNLEIISGRQEGIYQWLAINYVLGKFDHHVHSSISPSGKSISKVDIVQGNDAIVRPHTVGALDMVG